MMPDLYYPAVKTRQGHLSRDHTLSQQDASHGWMIALSSLFYYLPMVLPNWRVLVDVCSESRCVSRLYITEEPAHNKPETAGTYSIGIKLTTCIPMLP
jgi:hypothetical protein